MERTVCAALVTYNRKELLQGVLYDLAAQSYPIRAIILVNNNSSDGTEEMLQSIGFIDCQKLSGEVQRSVWQGVEVYYYKNQENTGSSGGFAKALEIAQQAPYDCIWIMDDDVSPEKDCLGNMMQYLDDEARACIPCRGDENTRDFAVQRYDLSNPFFFRVNQCKRDIVYWNEITAPYVYVEDMAFEGPLMDRQLICEIGLPYWGFFILYDDTEYAQRIRRKTKIRYVTGARMHRKLMPAKGRNWTWRTYYNTRNFVYFEKKYGKNWSVRYLRPLFRILSMMLRAFCKGRWKRFKWIIWAYKDGLNENMGKTYEPGEIYAE